jgi:hypothetical protein
MKAVLLLLMATAGESSRASATDNLLVIHYQPGGKKDQWLLHPKWINLCIDIFFLLLQRILCAHGPY